MRCDFEINVYRMVHLKIIIMNALSISQHFNKSEFCLQYYNYNKLNYDMDGLSTSTTVLKPFGLIFLFKSCSLPATFKK